MIYMHIVTMHCIQLRIPGESESHLLLLERRQTTEFIFVSSDGIG